MFRDADEELRRLEAELLADEEPELPEELDEPEELPPVYQNEPRHYRAYNTDHADTDMDSYSDEIRQGRRPGRVLSLIAVILSLTAAALAVYAWHILQQGG